MNVTTLLLYAGAGYLAYTLWAKPKGAAGQSDLDKIGALLGIGTNIVKERPSSQGVGMIEVYDSRQGGGVIAQGPSVAAILRELPGIMKTNGIQAVFQHVPYTGRIMIATGL